MLNRNISQMSLVREARKAVVENISKQLEYVTRAGHIAMQTILNLKQHYSSAPFIPP